MAEERGPTSRYEWRRAALHRWRTTAVADGRPDAGLLRDSDLAVIARSDATRPDDVRPLLTSRLTHLAEDVAVALALDTDELPRDLPRPYRRGALHRAAEPIGPAPVDVGEYADAGFAPVEPGCSDEPDHAVSVFAGATGRALSWPPVADAPPVVVYRVVSKDRTASWSPDAVGTFPVAVTAQCHAVDARPFTHARRYLDVWAHTGASREQAVATAPVRHAHSVVIAPVTDVVLMQDEDRVVGQWTAPDGATGVDVLRIPIEEMPEGSGDQRYQVATEGDHRAGLDDTGVHRGRTYIYQIRTVAPDDAGRLRYSDPVECEVEVAAELRPVRNLVAQPNGPDSVHLSWTRPPAGVVHVYRTQAPPTPGSDVRPMSAGHDALRRSGLPPEARLLHPARADAEGWAAMSEVPWPPGWTRAWFTPVTVLGGRAHVGEPARVLRPGAVGRPRLVERVHKELLAFGWPDGADDVWLFEGVADQDPSSTVTGQPSRQVSRDRYRRDGGMQLDPPLPGQGCSVHLVPIAFEGGETVRGPVTEVNYRGLLRMQYTITQRRSLIGKLTAFTLGLRSDLELTAPPSFVLVHRPDRLPLHIGDGAPIPLTATWDGNASPSVRITPPPMRAGDNPDIGWSADARGWDGGFLRLFPDVDEAGRAGIALLDPPVAQLRLLPTGRRAAVR